MESKKYFFKIIIPNYNNYIYIKKCLDSVLNQTFTDWHCIVVDDLSDDNSDRIAEIYAKRYPDKFTFLKMNEKGHEGGCRNMGIDYPIDCEYYYFIDSDDYLYDNEVLKDVFKKINNNYPDVLFVRMMMYNEILDKSHLISQKKFNVNDIELFLQGFNSACIKFVKSSKITKFLENCDHAADVYQFIKLMDQGILIEQFDRIAYVYRRNNNSITLNGRYVDDTDVFYSNIEKLSKTLKHTNILNAVLYRISRYVNGKIKF